MCNRIDFNSNDVFKIKRLDSYQYVWPPGGDAEYVFANE